MKKNLNRPLLLAAVLCLFSLVVMTATLLRPTKQERMPFTPPPFEPNAVQGVPKVPDGLGWGELDAQAFKISVCGVIKVVNDSADIWFTNPNENEVWLKLRVTDENGNVLSETGLLHPGEYVKQLHFETAPKSGQPICLKLMAYEPETYHSAGAAILNTVVR